MNDELNLDLVLKVQLEGVDEELFKRIEQAAKKTSDKIDKAFNFGKVLASIKLIQSAFNSLTVSVSKMVKLTATLVSTSVKGFSTIASSILGLTTRVSGLNLILNGLKSGFTGIGNIISSALSGVDLKGIIKESIELSSSLTEVQNVINVVFKDGAKAINDFAADAIHMFGMTTLATKQFAGKFGAALTTTGQSAKSVEQMSKALTALTADLASFYDIEQEVAAQKLFSGVISGQIKPMRELGVDMTKASLEAYALSKGIQTAYKDMSAAEKQALRFNYAMEKLAFVQGDYARTINSTANQMRLLRNALKELGSVVGTIINAFFNPLLTVLNRVVISVTNVVKTIASAMGIDWTLGTGSAGISGISGVANAYDDLSDSAEDLADSEDDVAKATGKASKEAKKALAPFHKLNILQNKAAEDSTGKGAGSGLGTIGDLADNAASAVAQNLPSIQDMIKNFFDWLWGLDWEGWMDGVINKVNEFFSDLPKKIQEFFDKLQPWIERIVNLFNQFVEGVDWGKIGESVSEVIEGIGRSIATAFATAHWDSYGEAFADFLNGLITNAQMFVQWGRVVGEGINGAFEFIANAAANIQWGTLGENLYLGLKEAFSKIDPKNIYDAIYGVLSGITTALNTFFNELLNNEALQKQIGDSVLAVIQAGIDFSASLEFDTLLQNIVDTITKALDFLDDEVLTDDNKEKIAKAISKVISAGAKILKKFFEEDGVAQDIFEILKQVVVEFFTNKDIPIGLKIVAAKELADITGLSNALGAVASALGSIIMFKQVANLISNIGSAAGTVASEVETLSGDVLSAEGKVLSYGGKLGGLKNTLATLGKAFTTIAPYIAAAAAVLAEFFLGEAGVQKLLGYDIEGSTFAEKWNSFWGNFAEITTNAWNNTVSLFTEVIPGVINGLAKAVGVGFDLLGKTIAEKLTALGEEIVKYFTPVKEGFETAFYFLVGVAATVWEQIQAVWAQVAKWFTDTVWTPIVTAAQTAITGILTFFTTLWTNIQTIWGEVVNWFNTSIWIPLTTAVQQLVTDIANFFTQLWVDIQKVWSEVVNWFDTNIWIPLTTAVNTLKETVVKFFTEMWTSIQKIWGEVTSWFENNIWKPFKTAVEEVIKKVKEDFGEAVDIVEQKWQGFLDFFNKLYNKIKGWLDDLIQKAKDFGTNMVNKGSEIINGSSSSSIPAGASGMIIQPNRPQLAIVGDQTRGVNVESPLSTMVEAFRTAAQDLTSAGFSGNITIPIYVDGVLSTQKVITASQMHNYRSNGR